MIYRETIYRASIYFDVYTGDVVHDVQSIERICDVALRRGHLHPEIKVSVNGGGPCYDPYIIIEGDDDYRVEKLATTIAAYAKRFKGIKFK